MNVWAWAQTHIALFDALNPQVTNALENGIAIVIRAFECTPTTALLLSVFYWIVKYTSRHPYVHRRVRIGPQTLLSCLRVWHQSGAACRWLQRVNWGSPSHMSTAKP